MSKRLLRNETLLRKCRSCGKTMALNLFVKTPSGKRGRGNFCKACKNKLARKRYQMMKTTSVNLNYRLVRTLSDYMELCTRHGIKLNDEITQEEKDYFNENGAVRISQQSSNYTKLCDAILGAAKKNS